MGLNDVPQVLIPKELMIFTKTLTWDVMATFGPDAITGLATTTFTFDTFEIAVPSVARVLSVADNIRLELEFRMVPK